MVGRIFRGMFLVLLFLGVCSTSRAQTAQISGQVHDPSGAVVPKAEVRVINQATLVERHAKTNEAGFYVVGVLDPGMYQVVVDVSGFQTVVSEKLALTVDQILVFNVQLKVGEVEEKVVVTMGSPTVDTNDAQIGNVVDQRQIVNLPLILRDPFQLVLLTAGVNASNSGGGGFLINGGRELNNNVRLDGVDDNDVEVPTLGVAGINPDSAQEFRVITTGFMPEFGRNNGAVIDVITKSGTNGFHGNLYEFGRWSALGARDFFNHQPDTPKDGYTRNIFGGSIGGPIRKDKTFFFFNYDGSRFTTTRTNESIVPTKEFLTGKFTFVGPDPTTGLPISVPIDVSTPNSPNNTFHLPLDPLIQTIFAKYPTPTTPIGNGLQGVFFFPSTEVDSGDNYALKVDHNFSPSENLSVRYVGGPGSFTNASHLDSLPGLGGIDESVLSQALSIHLTSTLSSSWLNDLILGANRFTLPATCRGLSTLNSLGPVDPIGNAMDYSFPAGTAGWGCIFLANSNGQTRHSGEYTLSDHVSGLIGRHSIKFGFEFGDLYSNNFTGFSSRTAVNFSNFAATLTPATVTGIPAADLSESLQDMLWTLFGETSSQFQSQFFNPSGNRLLTDELNMKERDYGIFGQDSFRVLPNLTLNYGLRWEFVGVPYEAHDLLSTVTPLSALTGPGPITFQNLGHGLSIYSMNPLEIQPRFGIAWDPFKTGKTSIRAGYGIFRDRIFLGLADSIRGNPPLTETEFIPIFSPTSGGGFTGTPVSLVSAPATLIPSPTVQNGALLEPVIVQPNSQLPYSQNWNLGFQRDLPENVQIEVNYVGIQGKRLLRQLDGHQPDPALVAQLRAFCQHPNPFNCIDGPNASTVQGINLYLGAEEGLLPFDAVNNNAIGHDGILTTSASSTYNALQTTVTKRLSHGIFIQGAYTWAHEIDDASSPIGPTFNNAFSPANSFDLRAERGNGSADIRQVLVLNYTMELPFGEGKTRLNKGFVGKALGGWSFSGITDFSGGLPYDIFTLRDSDGTGGDLGRPDFNPKGTLVAVASPRTQTGPNPGLFSEPLFGGPGNLARNVFRVPGKNTWDVVLTKTSKITERFNLDFRTECYNLFNRVQFSPPDNIIEDPAFGQSFSQVGQPDGTTGARQFQFALKLHF